MLLNLTNHPSADWPPSQKQEARKQFGTVQDLPFPTVPPDASGQQLDELADAYLARIRSIQPSAVHLMGELTFCYRLANRLKAAGIPVIASTTHRVAVTGDQGIKTSKFEFVRFRSY